MSRRNSKREQSSSCSFAETLQAKKEIITLQLNGASAEGHKAGRLAHDVINKILFTFPTPNHMNDWQDARKNAYDRDINEYSIILGKLFGSAINNEIGSKIEYNISSKANQHTSKLFKLSAAEVSSLCLQSGAGIETLFHLRKFQQEGIKFNCVADLTSAIHHVSVLRAEQQLQTFMESLQTVTEIEISYLVEFLYHECSNLWIPPCFGVIDDIDEISCDQRDILTLLQVCGSLQKAIQTTKSFLRHQIQFRSFREFILSASNAELIAQSDFLRKKSLLNVLKHPDTQQYLYHSTVSEKESSLMRQIELIGLDQQDDVVTESLLLSICNEIKYKQQSKLLLGRDVEEVVTVTMSHASTQLFNENQIPNIMKSAFIFSRAVRHPFQNLESLVHFVIEEKKKLCISVGKLIPGGEQDNWTLSNIVSQIFTALEQSGKDIYDVETSLNYSELRLSQVIMYIKYSLLTQSTFRTPADLFGALVNMHKRSLSIKKQLLEYINQHELFGTLNTDARKRIARHHHMNRQGNPRNIATFLHAELLSQVVIIVQKRVNPMLISSFISLPSEHCYNVIQRLYETGQKFPSFLLLMKSVIMATENNFVRQHKRLNELRSYFKTQYGPDKLFPMFMEVKRYSNGSVMSSSQQEINKRRPNSEYEVKEYSLYTLLRITDEIPKGLHGLSAILHMLAKSNRRYSNIASLISDVQLVVDAKCALYNYLFNSKHSLFSSTCCFVAEDIELLWALGGWSTIDTLKGLERKIYQLKSREDILEEVVRGREQVDIDIQLALCNKDKHNLLGYCSDLKKQNIIDMNDELKDKIWKQWTSSGILTNTKSLLRILYLYEKQKRIFSDVNTLLKQTELDTIKWYNNLKELINYFHSPYSFILFKQGIIISSTITEDMVEEMMIYGELGCDTVLALLYFRSLGRQFESMFELIEATRIENENIKQDWATEEQERIQQLKLKLWSQTVDLEERENNISDTEIRNILNYLNDENTFLFGNEIEYIVIYNDDVELLMTPFQSSNELLICLKQLNDIDRHFNSIQELYDAILLFLDTGSPLSAAQTKGILDILHTETYQDEEMLTARMRRQLATNSLSGKEAASLITACGGYQRSLDILKRFLNQRALQLKRKKRLEPFKSFQELVLNIIDYRSSQFSKRSSNRIELEQSQVVSLIDDTELFRNASVGNLEIYGHELDNLLNEAQSMNKLQKHLIIYNDMQREFNSINELCTAVRISTKTNHHTDYNSRKQIILYLNSEDCRLLPKQNEIRYTPEEMDRLFIAVPGPQQPNILLNRLKEMNEKAKEASFCFGFPNRLLFALENEKKTGLLIEFQRTKEVKPVVKTPPKPVKRKHSLCIVCNKEYEMKIRPDQVNLVIGYLHNEDEFCILEDREDVPIRKRDIIHIIHLLEGYDNVMIELDKLQKTGQSFLDMDSITEALIMGYIHNIYITDQSKDIIYNELMKCGLEYTKEMSEIIETKSISENEVLLLVELCGGMQEFVDRFKELIELRHKYYIDEGYSERFVDKIKDLVDELTNLNNSEHLTTTENRALVIDSIKKSYIFYNATDETITEQDLDDLICSERDVNKLINHINMYGRLNIEFNTFKDFKQTLEEARITNCHVSMEERNKLAQFLKHFKYTESIFLHKEQLDDIQVVSCSGLDNIYLLCDCVDIEKRISLISSFVFSIDDLVLCIEKEGKLKKCNVCNSVMVSPNDDVYDDVKLYLNNAQCGIFNKKKNDADDDDENNENNNDNKLNNDIIDHWIHLVNNIDTLFQLFQQFDIIKRTFQSYNEFEQGLLYALETNCHLSHDSINTVFTILKKKKYKRKILQRRLYRKKILKETMSLSTVSSLVMCCHGLDNVENVLDYMIMNNKNDDDENDNIILAKSVKQLMQNIVNTVYIMDKQIDKDRQYALDTLIHSCLFENVNNNNELKITIGELDELIYISKNNVGRLVQHINLLNSFNCHYNTIQELIIAIQQAEITKCHVPVKFQTGLKEYFGQNIDFMHLVDELVIHEIGGELMDLLFLICTGNAKLENMNNICRCLEQIEETAQTFEQLVDSTELLFADDHYPKFDAQSDKLLQMHNDEVQLYCNELRKELTNDPVQLTQLDDDDDDDDVNQEDEGQSSSSSSDDGDDDVHNQEDEGQSSSDSDNTNDNNKAVNSRSTSKIIFPSTNSRPVSAANNIESEIEYDRVIDNDEQVQFELLANYLNESTLFNECEEVEMTWDDVDRLMNITDGNATILIEKLKRLEEKGVKMKIFNDIYYAIEDQQNETEDDGKEEEHQDKEEQVLKEEEIKDTEIKEEPSKKEELNTN